MVLPTIPATTEPEWTPIRKLIFFPGRSHKRRKRVREERVSEEKRDWQRHTEIERDRHSQTKIQKKRQTETVTDRQTHKQTETGKQTETDRDGVRQTKIDRQRQKETDRDREGAKKQTAWCETERRNRQDRHDGQTDRLTDTQIVWQKRAEQTNGQT